MTNAMTKTKVAKEYEDQLTADLIPIYKKVVKERKYIYYTGYILGFIVALVLLLGNSYLLNKKYTTSTMICQTLLISFVVNYFYYTLTPKKTMMLDHIKTEEQAKSWLKMYKGIQYNYHAGMVVGLVAVGLMAYAFRCV
jgi:tetrahydromethanopterin S-methyltransferase subunit B